MANSPRYDLSTTNPLCTQSAAPHKHVPHHTSPQSSGDNAISYSFPPGIRSSSCSATDALLTKFGVYCTQHKTRMRNCDRDYLSMSIVIALPIYELTQKPRDASGPSSPLRTPFERPCRAFACYHLKKRRRQQQVPHEQTPPRSAWPISSDKSRASL